MPSTNSLKNAYYGFEVIEKGNKLIETVTNKILLIHVDNFITYWPKLACEEYLKEKIFQELNYENRL